MEPLAMRQRLTLKPANQWRYLAADKCSTLQFRLQQRIMLARQGDQDPGSAPPNRTDDQLERVLQELHEIRALYNLAVSVGSSLNLETVLWKLYKESSLLIKTANFAIILFDQDTASLNFVLIIDQGRQLKPRLVKFTESGGLIRQVLTCQTPLLVPDLLANNGPLASHDALPPQAHSWLGVPIFNPALAEEGAQGVIAIWSYEPDAFTDHEEWLLSAIGHQAAIAVRNAHLYQISQRQAAENARLHKTVLAERDRVIEAQEEARKTLAGELHDGPTQIVSAVMMHLDFCRMLVEHEPARLAKELTTTRDLAQRAVHQIRTLLFELRPLALETRGLVAALNVFVERRQEEIIDQPKLTLELHTGQPEGELLWRDKKVETALFAIVQETVNNAIKHAAASEIRVQLKETDDAIRVIISDDGEGFDVQSVLADYDQCGSLGMLNLHERADLIGADLTLESAPEHGTKITVWVPKSRRARLKKRGHTGPLRARAENR